MNEITIDYQTGTATFFIDMEASADRSVYKGIFKVKCVLSPLEYINADSMYRELLGKTNPQYASDYVGQLCYALSQLKYRVMDSPDWFKNRENGINGSSIDDTILLYILDKAVDSEAQYRDGIKERYENAKKSVRKAIDDGELKSDKKEKETEE